MTWTDILKIVALTASISVVIGVVVALVATSIIDDLTERDKRRKN